MKIQWMKTGMAVLFGLILLPAAAVAQTPEERVGAALTRAEAAGIPLTLLQSKIDEGKAKGIPMDRIAAAIDARLAGLEKARTAMTQGANGANANNDVNAAELSVGADAIGAGVSAAVLAEIAASTGHDKRAVAIAALTELVAQGIAPEAALGRVQDALARGPQALANLPGVVGSHGPSGAGAPSTIPGTGSTSAPTSVPTPGQATAPTPPQRSGRGGF